MDNSSQYVWSWYRRITTWKWRDYNSSQEKVDLTVEILSSMFSLISVVSESLSFLIETSRKKLREFGLEITTNQIHDGGSSDGEGAGAGDETTVGSGDAESSGGKNRDGKQCIRSEKNGINGRTEIYKILKILLKECENFLRPKFLSFSQELKNSQLSRDKEKILGGGDCGGRAVSYDEAVYSEIAISQLAQFYSQRGMSKTFDFYVSVFRYKLESHLSLEQLSHRANKLLDKYFTPWMEGDDVTWKELTNFFPSVKQMTKKKINLKYLSFHFFFPKIVLVISWIGSVS
eukprot:TRINITY_DN6981_c0_g2_i1.p1 TRINITY_DN6981_c0_g2~~TRINITY_DN6981_c0_g2_i1.p1  ORF type:complete len:289 (-),score=72.64 TRINITY_DN6981_c0_g2_i1:391-1257(-)